MEHLVIWRYFAWPFGSILLDKMAIKHHQLRAGTPAWTLISVAGAEASKHHRTQHQIARLGHNHRVPYTVGAE